VNIELEAEGYERDRDCPKSNCIIAMIEEFDAILKSATAIKSEDLRHFDSGQRVSVSRRCARLYRNTVGAY